MSLLEWLAAGILIVLVIFLVGCAMAEIALREQFGSIKEELESLKEELEQMKSSLDAIQGDVSSLEGRFVDHQDINLDGR